MARDKFAERMWRLTPLRHFTEAVENHRRWAEVSYVENTQKFAQSLPSRCSVTVISRFREGRMLNKQLSSRADGCETTGGSPSGQASRAEVSGSVLGGKKGADLAGLSQLAPSEVQRIRFQLLRYARKAMKGNTEEAEDLVQQTLIAALEARAPYVGAAPLIGWLMGILKHKIMDDRKRHIKESIARCSNRDGEALDFETLLECWSPEASSPLRGPLAALEMSDFFDVLAQEVGRLSPTVAKTFVLSDVEGSGVPSICQELGVTRSNCGVMLHRARTKLRAALSARGYGN